MRLRTVYLSRVLVFGLVGLVGPGGVPAVADPLSTIVALINQARWENGRLPPLKRTQALDSAADTHVGRMIEFDFCSHDDPVTGSTIGSRIFGLGYHYAGEVFYWHSHDADPALAVDWWVYDSAIHRAVVLSDDFTEVGVGFGVVAGANHACQSQQASARYIWLLDFGHIAGRYPLIIDNDNPQTSTCQVSLYLYGAGKVTSLRLRNDTGGWSQWMTFQSTLNWPLSGDAGLKTVTAELRTGGQTSTVSDTIELVATSGCGSASGPILKSDFEG